MADINKIGLWLTTHDKNRFLVCEKSKNDMTADFIMPGGQVETGESDEQCLVREIAEELDVKLDEASLEFLGEYIDVAAGAMDKLVSIRLYQGKITGEPVPSQEIKQIHWIGKDGHERLSPIIRNKILPDVAARGLLN